MPFEGLKDGPVATLAGIRDGTSSLIKKAFSGLFNSIYQISNSIANGISHITFDEK